MKPFSKGTLSYRSEQSLQAQARAQHSSMGCSYEDALEAIRNVDRDIVDNETAWVNDEYQVNVAKVPEKPNWPAMVHLSIKRLDKGPITGGWRVFQEIKNAILSPDHEAVELYPMEERAVDSANQYHLWALAEAGLKFPFGFNATRYVTNDVFIEGHGQSPREETE